MSTKTQRVQKFRDDIDKVERMKKDGLSANEIASQYGVSSCTVRRSVKEPFTNPRTGVSKGKVELNITAMKRLALCEVWR